MKLNTVRRSFDDGKGVSGTYVTTATWGTKKNKFCLTKDEGKDTFSIILQDTTDRCFSVSRERFNFVFEDSRGQKVWSVNIKNPRLPETVEEQYASLPPPEKTPETLSTVPKEKIDAHPRKTAELEKKDPSRMTQII